MKFLGKFNRFLVVTAILACYPAYSTEIAESRLKVSSGKMLFTLVKTEWSITAKMSGIADRFTGTIDMESKTVKISGSVSRGHCYLTGAYKFANELLHEGFLDSEKFPFAKFEGTIESYDPAAGEAKVKGTMEIHGVKKENFELSGKLKKEGSEYLFESKFKFNPKDFQMNPPKIKEVDAVLKLKIKAE